MNYFDFFQIPVAFVLDEALLKRKFYANSKQYHPDFFATTSPEEQAHALHLSTLNNEAYRTLADPDSRMQYVLNLKEVLAEEGQNEVPSDFLAEMMELNEALMELEFDFEEEMLKKVSLQVDELEKGLYEEVAPLLIGYDDQQATPEALSAIKDYYFKRKYLLRIRENLSKFATH
ncbi:MAG: Fe-S protein assembly co-chaperone HscB [Saprospiraceae bacterium]|jgi:molecular chaperone HscB|nr:Fe-S protein assembly co-chaperone HscB [Saprospiraceae bacterium]